VPVGNGAEVVACAGVAEGGAGLGVGGCAVLVGGTTSASTGRPAAVAGMAVLVAGAGAGVEVGGTAVAVEVQASTSARSVARLKIGLWRCARMDSPRLVERADDWDATYSTSIATRSLNGVSSGVEGSWPVGSGPGCARPPASAGRHSPVAGFALRCCGVSDGGGAG